LKPWADIRGGFRQKAALANSPNHPAVCRPPLRTRNLGARPGTACNLSGNSRPLFARLSVATFLKSVTATPRWPSKDLDHHIEFPLNHFTYDHVRFFPFDPSRIQFVFLKTGSLAKTAIQEGHESRPK